MYNAHGKDTGEKIGRLQSFLFYTNKQQGVILACAEIYPKASLKFLSEQGIIDPILKTMIN